MDTQIPKLLDLDYKTPGNAERQLLDAYHRHIVGQDRALRHLVRDLLVANAYGGRTCDSTKLRGVFFSFGPTGSGKTYFPEITALLTLGRMDAFTKIDCSELQQSHETARLIGAPQGYVRSEEEPLLSQRRIDWPAFMAQKDNPMLYKEHALKGSIEYFQRALEKNIEKKRAMEAKKETAGAAYEEVKKEGRTLFEAVQRAREEHKDFMGKHPEVEDIIAEYKPEDGYFSIVLFDEIEKAHLNVHHLLYQILDKAQVTHHGSPKYGSPVTRFHNTFMFFSSNIAEEKIQKSAEGKSIGFRPARTYTRPELVREAEEERKRIYRIGFDEIKRRFPTPFISRIGKERFYAFSRPTIFEAREYLDRIIIPRFQKEVGELFLLKLELTPEARTYLVDESFDKDNRILGHRAVLSVFGRRIRQNLMSLLMKTKDENGVLPGDEVVVDLGKNKEEENELVFKIRERSPEKQKRAEELSAAIGGKKGRALKGGRHIAPIPFYGA